MSQEEITKREKFRQANSIMTTFLSPYVAALVSMAKVAMGDRKFEPKKLKLLTVTGEVVLGHDSVAVAMVPIYENRRLGPLDRARIWLGRAISGEIFSLEENICGRSVTLHIYSF